jgi:hypothetical protein
MGGHFHKLQDKLEEASWIPSMVGDGYHRRDVRVYRPRQSTSHSRDRPPGCSTEAIASHVRAAPSYCAMDHPLTLASGVNVSWQYEGHSTKGGGIAAPGPFKAIGILATRRHLVPGDTATDFPSTPTKTRPWALWRSILASLIQLLHRHRFTGTHHNID